MKRKQSSSIRASALQVTFSITLLASLAILFASSFNAAPAGASEESSGTSAPALAEAAPSSTWAGTVQPVKATAGSPLASNSFTFANTGSLNTARGNHTATLLPNGKLLVAGGATGNHLSLLTSSELYDPANGSWAFTGSLNTARHGHTATLLANGKVLVAGGNGAFGALTSAELYDPASGSWTATGSLNASRQFHTATLLANGKVLVAGGEEDGLVPLVSAELYDPTSGSWTATGSLNTGHLYHTTTLLPNGKVLVAGGYGTFAGLTSAELYDPASGSWTATGSLNTGRYHHTATLLPNGKVLAVGGVSNGPSPEVSELYDPANGSWTATVSPVRRYHTAMLLPNGKVLVAGGEDSAGNFHTVYLYDPANGNWTTTGSINTARSGHTATLLPNGEVLVAGGNAGFFLGLTSAELYDSASGSWTATGSLGAARQFHTATLLPNGKVLVAGGGGSGGTVTSAELYDAASGNWSATGSLGAGREGHTATLLPNGKVLVAGGFHFINGILTSAEVYDPASGSWSATGSLGTARDDHTATLLPNGKVLVVGGRIPSGIFTSAEVYDPASGSWSATGSLGTGRYSHTATLLPDGKVLVAGGFNNGNSFLTSAEVYNPASGSWSATGSLGVGRSNHTATLLPNGKVLVAGGYGGHTSAEVYDPASGSWSATGSLGTARAYHTATLLPNGQVLVAGGENILVYLASVELYDPASGSWSDTGSLGAAREYHTATLLPNGQVLVAGGGVAFVTYLTSAELYDVGLGFLRPDWQPQIATVTSPLAQGSRLVLTGSRFQGISQASSGNIQDSSSNYPVVQLRSIDNSQVMLLLPDPAVGWSDTSFTSGPVSNFPSGPALVTVFTNGIPSDARYLVVAASACAPIPAGMVSWWPLETNGVDIFGPNAGTPQGSPAPVFGPGKVNQAMNVTGNNGISVPNNITLNFGVNADLSIDAWIKTGEMGRNTLTIVDKRLINGVNVTGYVIYLFNGRLGFQLGVGGSGLDATNLSGDLRNGQWHHIAITVDRDSATGGKAYVDGVQTGTFNPTARNGNLSNTQPFLIGRHETAAIANFIGTIDEVELFSRALAGAEVASIYNAGSMGKCLPTPSPTCAPTPAGMVSWWPLETSSGADIAGPNGGIPHNGPTFGPGKVNQAMSVTGNNGMLVPNSLSLNFGANADLSIDAWIKTSEMGRNTLTIVDKRVISGTSVTGYVIYLFNGKLGFQLGVGGSGLDATNLSGDLRNGTWHHLAITVDRDSATGGKAYVDGVQTGTFNPTSRSGNLTNTAPLLIGEHETAPVASFIGAIDEVDLFSRALTGAEVASIYNAGSTGKCH